jgi:hypothetical protein
MIENQGVEQHTNLSIEIKILWVVAGIIPKTRDIVELLNTGPIVHIFCKVSPSSAIWLPRDLAA